MVGAGERQGLKAKLVLASPFGRGGFLQSKKTERAKNKKRQGKLSFAVPCYCFVTVLSCLSLRKRWQCVALTERATLRTRHAVSLLGPRPSALGPWPSPEHFPYPLGSENISLVAGKVSALCLAESCGHKQNVHRGKLLHRHIDDFFLCAHKHKGGKPHKLL